MMQGYPLSATLPEDSGLGERFWYWRGASGQSYIHSIYSPDHCPPVAGAVFVVVRKVGGTRSAVAVGRFDAEGLGPQAICACSVGDEIHVHLLASDSDSAGKVRVDLEAALEDARPALAEPKIWRKPIQLELLAA